MDSSCCLAARLSVLLLQVCESSQRLWGKAHTSSAEGMLIVYISAMLWRASLVPLSFLIGTETSLPATRVQMTSI